MNKRVILLTTLVLSISWSCAQSLTGSLKAHANQIIRLTGFNYYNPITLDTDTITAAGAFNLKYPKNYNGMGIIQAQDNTSLVLMLTEPNIELTGTHLSETNRLVYVKGLQNNEYLQFAKAKNIRDDAYMALKYLEPLYRTQEALANKKAFANSINQEINRLEQADVTFLNTLDQKAYLRWFLPLKQLVQDMPASYNRYPERIPDHIIQFRKTNFNHPNFKTSGLLRELIEGHYLMLENMGQSLDSILSQMQLSNTYLINNIQKNKPLVNQVGEELFAFLEKRSLYKASEHLAVQLLEKASPNLEESLSKRLEKYRALKVGNKVKDFQVTQTKKLSDYKQPVLLVFGVSNCPPCRQGVKELLKEYPKWKSQKNTEVIYVSLDTNPEAYSALYGNVPWPMLNENKGWESELIKSYFIYGTPTYLMLDSENKIVSHINSVAHANAYITYTLND